MPLIERRYLPLALVALAGIAIRVGALALADPLLIDEAMLVHTVATRAWADLTPPFAYQQVVPPGLLFLTKLATVAFGFSEPALRLAPFLASMATLLILVPLATRLLPPLPAVIAVGLVALSPPFIRYSDELKQYALDVLTAAGMLYLTVRILARPTRRNRWLWVIGGAASLAFSTAAPLVLAGAWLGVLLDDRSASADRPRQALLSAAVTWAGAFALIFFGFYRPAETRYLEQFWVETFLDPRLPGFLGRITAAVDAVVAVGFAPYLTAGPELMLAAIALIAVPYWYVRPRRPLAVAMLAPMALAAVAAALHRYPISQRTLLFALPGLALTAGAAIATLTAKERPHWLRAFGIVGGIALMIGPAAALIRWNRSRTPQGGWEDMVTVLAQPGSGPVYLSARGIPEFAYYSTDWSHPDTARLRRLAAIADSLGPNSGNNGPRGRPIVSEGDGAIIVDRGRELLIGIPTGMEVTGSGRSHPTVPDQGWEENEARRIDATAGDSAWVVLVRMRSNAITRLIGALRRTGASVDTLRDESTALLLRVRWPR